MAGPPADGWGEVTEAAPPRIGQKEGKGVTGGTYVEEISSLRSRGESQIDEEIDTGSH